MSIRVAGAVVRASFRNGACAAALSLGAACPGAFAQPGSASLTNSTYLTTSGTQGINAQQFTLEAWILPEGPGYGNTNDGFGATIIAKPRQGDSGTSLSPWVLQWSALTERVTFAVGHVHPSIATLVVSNATVPVRTAAHVAATFDGVTARLYVNGQLDVSAPAMQPQVFHFGSDPVLIGAGNYCCGYLRRWQGKIDDVRVWDVVRTDEQIAASISCELPGPVTGLLANWVFNDGVPRDVSGNNRDAAFVAGAPAFGEPLAGGSPVLSPLPDRLICPGGELSLSVGLGSPGNVSYVWQADNAKGGWTDLADGPLLWQGKPTCAAISGTASPTLTLSLQCLEGAPGVDDRRFRCIVTNECATITSGESSVRLCRADFNCDASLNSQDFFDFLAAFFEQSPSSDFNDDSLVNSQDFFDFLSAFFAGC